MSKVCNNLFHKKKKKNVYSKLFLLEYIYKIREGYVIHEKEGIMLSCHAREGNGCAISL